MLTLPAFRAAQVGTNRGPNPCTGDSVEEAQESREGP